ncbi:hypothetical protein CKAH01_04447 [Colletotrichum kahawae]|uniref:Uncharacterized protein n=1 Tax=Colletotrichum kahawae TaxID=34407 RepID=A0AAD9YL49_COLKA|nr:hypothetical protein CKAH01_04447 [Colletotrichum kahawae]
MKLSMATLSTLSILAPTTVLAGLCAYGTCQAGCAALAVVCYSGTGATFGVTCGLAATPAVLACNAAFGQCQASCWLAGFAPTC